MKAEGAIVFDKSNFLDDFNKMYHEIPYAIAAAQNTLAFNEARDNLSAHIRNNLNLKAKVVGSKRAIKYIKADKKTTTSTLYFQLGSPSLSINKSIPIQEHKGTQKNLYIPMRDNMATYLKVGKSSPIRKKGKSSLAFAQANIGNKINKMSIFKKKTTKRGAGGIFANVNGKARLLWLWVDTAKHTKQYIDFAKVLETTYEKRYDRHFSKVYNRLLKKNGFK